MQRILRIVPFILLAFAVVYLEDAGIDTFTFWNILPLVICSMVIEVAVLRKDYVSKVGASMFCLFCLGFHFGLHCMWFFNIAEFQTGSSTSGLIFIFLPIYSVVLGFVGLVLGFILGVFLENGP